MSLDYQTIGKRVRRLREQQKLTQGQLAKRANRSPSFIGFIERGDRVMSIETLLELAQALNCTTDELLGRELVNIDSESCARELLEMARMLAKGKRIKQ